MISKNIPTIKLGLIASSRNNFADELSLTSRKQIADILTEKGVEFYEIQTLVVTETDSVKALKEAEENGCNALAVVLGNFGPETPETIIAKRFDGPVMYAAVSEISKDTMFAGRRDSYCGLLNASYNLDIRNCKAYIPKYPVGTAEEITVMIQNFLPVARVIVGVSHLKMIVFGPRPNDFLACNAPIKPLFDLGAEIQENSELDLYLAFLDHKGDSRIPETVASMKKIVGEKYPDTLEKMAQYELTLLDWIEDNRGASDYVCLANKCWPSFQKAFGFLPCLVHSRLAAAGIPVGCETDIYGGLSEFIGACVSDVPTAILDINNNISIDVYEEMIKGQFGYDLNEIFVGFHCGNTANELLCSSGLSYKMNRKDPYAPETGKEQTRGVLEGRMKPGKVSVFRLHSSAEGNLQSYVGEGEILPVALNTYGCYAVFGIKGMEKFYRHVLIGKHFPHHSAIVYGDHAAQLYEAMQYLGIGYVGCNRMEDIHYENEVPFEYEYK